MNLLRFFLLAFLLTASRLPAQSGLQQPKLIIGIVVDQMRYDFLYRFSDDYGDDGFKRLLREGFSCENTHFNYMPTYTAPGHAAIYTGTTPSVNGIIGNFWWDRQSGGYRYVTTDTTVRSTGTSGRAGQHSPKVLLSSTITDELRLSNSFRSKVAAVCLKDRGSVLPAGHIPDACYWFSDKEGNWITSSYYTDTLPEWVAAFNARNPAGAYLSKPWLPLRPASAYTESFAGWNQYEHRRGNNKTGNFPYDLPAMQKARGDFGIIRTTPFGNDLTLDFALELIDKMDLGNDAFPDFLSISFSGTDYCGHHFGLHAEETQDVYLRLDLQIARLLQFLDARFGKDQVLVFLTSDHGAAETPRHLADLQFPVDVFPESALEKKLDSLVSSKLSAPGPFILKMTNQQVWMDTLALARAGSGAAAVAPAIIDFLKKQPGVYDAFTYQEALQLPSEYPFIGEVRRGLHPRRSGDILFLLDPGWHADDKYNLHAGTTHGSPYAYDTHIPLLWYGWKVPVGSTHAPVSITDIAPTLAAMLRIMEPNGNTGKIIEPLLMK
jgi:hypothetical protein